MIGGDIVREHIAGATLLGANWLVRGRHDQPPTFVEFFFLGGGHSPAVCSLYYCLNDKQNVRALDLHTIHVVIEQITFQMAPLHYCFTHFFFNKKRISQSYCDKLDII